jgi:hypothetical protein
MSKLTVHCFRQYDITKNDYLVSSRMATKEAIDKLGDGFSAIEGTATEIDSADLDPNEPGMTKINYRTLKPNEDLTPYVGARLRIEKAGHVHEGMLIGRGPMVTVTKAGGPVVPYWVLDENGSHIHFVAPGDGWVIRCLGDGQPRHPITAAG